MKKQIKAMKREEESFIKTTTDINRLIVLQDREWSWLRSCGYKGADFSRRKNSAITKTIRLIDERLSELQKK
jgi:hypothetical protein